MRAVAKDKRQSPRLNLKSSLRYRVLPMGAEGYRKAIVEDVSLTGFRFWSQEFIPRQAGFLLEMNLAGHAPIRSLAKAVWVRERPDDAGYEVGGMFVEPTHDSQTTLNQLVSGRC